MVGKFATAVTAVTMTLAAGVANASNLDFNLMNNTGEPIVALWVAPSQNGTWGRAVSNTFVSQAGGGQRINFTNGGSEYSGTCFYDMRVQFSGGAVRHWVNVNLCSVSGFRVYVAGGQVRGITYLVTGLLIGGKIPWTRSPASHSRRSSASHRQKWRFASSDATVRKLCFKTGAPFGQSFDIYADNADGHSDRRVDWPDPWTGRSCAVSSPGGFISSATR